MKVTAPGRCNRASCEEPPGTDPYVSCRGAKAPTKKKPTQFSQKRESSLAFSISREFLYTHICLVWSKSFIYGMCVLCCLVVRYQHRSGVVVVASVPGRSVHAGSFTVTVGPLCSLPAFRQLGVILARGCSRPGESNGLKCDAILAQGVAVGEGAFAFHFAGGTNRLRRAPSGRAAISRQ